MPCIPFTANGATGVLCVRGARKRKCHVCGRPATKECDYPKGKRTCDKALCDTCAVNVGPDKDFCPDHPKEPLTAPTTAAGHQNPVR